jgi:hypothetical protein
MGKKIYISVNKTDIANGHSNDTKTCPVAKALFRYGVRLVDVTTDRIKGKFEGHRFEIATPAAAKRFIRQFDAQMNVDVKPFRFSFTL